MWITAIFEALAMAAVALAGQFSDQSFPELAPRRGRPARRKAPLGVPERRTGGPAGLVLPDQTSEPAA
jgi:hypothetical protein